MLMLNKTAVKDVSRRAKPGGFQMGPSSGKWHTILSTSL